MIQRQWYTHYTLQPAFCLKSIYGLVNDAVQTFYGLLQQHLQLAKKFSEEYNPHRGVFTRNAEPFEGGGAPKRVHGGLKSAG